MRRGIIYKQPQRMSLEWPNVYQPMQERLVMLANMINTEFNKPFTITCLARTPEENARVGGKTDSLHTVSPTRAADFRIHTWVAGQKRDLYTQEELDRIVLFWRTPGRKWGIQIEKDHVHVQVKP